MKFKVCYADFILRNHKMPMVPTVFPAGWEHRWHASEEMLYRCCSHLDTREKRENQWPAIAVFGWDAFCQAVVEAESESICSGRGRSHYKITDSAALISDSAHNPSRPTEGSPKPTDGLLSPIQGMLDRKSAISRPIKVNSS